MEPAPPFGPHRSEGPRAGRTQPSRVQPRVPDRRIRLDERGQQAAARSTLDEDARRRAEHARSSVHRRLCRRGGARAAADRSRGPRGDPPCHRLAACRRQHRRGSRHPPGLPAGAPLVHRRRRQPRRARHRRRFQRRHQRSKLADRSDRKRGAHRRRPDRARFRHGQPQGLASRATRRPRQRQLRLHRQPPRGPQGARRGSGRHARHDREGRQDPGRVQPRRGRGVPADRLREPCASRRRLQRRHQGRGRDRRRPHRHRAVRDRPARASSSVPLDRPAQVPAAASRTPRVRALGSRFDRSRELGRVVDGQDPLESAGRQSQPASRARRGRSRARSPSGQ